MKNILLGVGPTALNPNILSGIDLPVNLCQSSKNREIVMSLENKINSIFGQGRHSFAIPGSGSAGMEACLVNILKPGDTVVVGAAGVFGQRIAEMARRLDANVIMIETALGEAVSYNALEKVLKANNVKLVCLVHLEASTGVLQPMESCREMIKKYDAFLMLDTVASFGGVELELDKWGVDIAYASTQKCLSCPPGLSIISLNERVLSYLKKEHEKSRSWYFDFLSIYEHVIRGVYPYTTPMLNLLFLSKALDDINNIGFSAYSRRQRECGEKIENFLEAEGFVLLPKKSVVAPNVKVFFTKEGIDAVKLKNTLENNHGIQIATGIGKLKNTVIRVGTMGTSANVEEIYVFCDSIKFLISAGERK